METVGCYGCKTITANITTFAFEGLMTGLHKGGNLMFLKYSMTFSEWLHAPLPWWIAGPLIGLIIPLLLILGNKSFGISSSLRHICAACFPANISFFKYNWKKESWNLFFVAGIIAGAMICSIWL